MSSNKPKRERNRKIPYDPKKSLITPPSKGASEGAIPIEIDNKPNIFTVSSFDEKSLIIALDRLRLQRKIDIV